MSESLLTFLNDEVTYPELRKCDNFIPKPDANGAVVGTIGGVDYELVHKNTMKCVPVGDEKPPDPLLP
jgi:hypothetical protein